MKSGLLSAIKRSFVQPKLMPRTIVAGPFKGLRMNLDLASQSQIYLGLFEKEVHESLRSLSKGIRSAIDVGAAYGEYTLYFLERTNAEVVFAFEPETEQRMKLESNLNLNSTNRSRLKISDSFIGDAQNEGRWCNLDSLVSAIEEPCLIKIDIEGAESLALAGAKEMLKMPRVRWLIETHSIEEEARCLEALHLANYQTRIIKNAWWRFAVPEQRPRPHNRWLIAAQPRDIDISA